MRAAHFYKTALLPFCVVSGLAAGPAGAAMPENFGTASATAQIASKIPPVDVVGIRLGMSANEAMAVLKAENPGYKIEVAPPLTFTALPNVPLNTGVLARAGTYQPNYPSGISTGEGILYALTAAPSAPVVWMVRRELEYQQANVRPATSNIFAAIKQKYGPESYVFDSGNSSDHAWYFDLQGKLIPNVNGNRQNQFNACEGGFGGPQVSVNANAVQNIPSSLQQRLDKGFQTVWNNGSGPWSNYCAQLGSMVRVRLEDQEPGRLRHVVVEAWNLRLMWSSVEATRTMLLQGQSKAEESQINQARQRPVPKF
ncbi:MAG TPA: hypothetical protein VGM68_11880 [Rhizomicrobium sp.]